MIPQLRVKSTCKFSRAHRVHQKDSKHAASWGYSAFCLDNPSSSHVVLWYSNPFSHEVSLGSMNAHTLGRGEEWNLISNRQSVSAILNALKILEGLSTGAHWWVSICKQHNLLDWQATYRTYNQGYGIEEQIVLWKKSLSPNDITWMLSAGHES